MSTETSEKFCAETRYNGQVKWFNNKAGYGFITMLHEDETYDIFVHHSSLSVTNEQYKYLVQGEYVEFNIARITTENATHEWQATDVTGFNRGFLMCETRYNTRSTRRTYSRSSTDENVPSQIQGHEQRQTRQQSVTTTGTRNYGEQQPRRRPYVQRDTSGGSDATTGRQYSRAPRADNIPVRFYGQGPRGGSGEQWLLVRSTSQSHYQQSQGQGQVQRRRPYVQHSQQAHQ